MRQCSQCKKLGVGPKADSEFCKGSGSDGLQSMCREHTREYNRAWAKKNVEKNRAKTRRYREAKPVASRKNAVKSSLKRGYGLTPEQYAELFRKQRARCAICEITLVSQLDDTREFKGHPANNLARVDHDHATGAVRGLLCFSCNVGLGKFGDSEKGLLAALGYLRASRATLGEAGRLQDAKLQGEKGPASRDPDQANSRGTRRDDLSPFI